MMYGADLRLHCKCKLGEKTASVTIDHRKASADALKDPFPIFSLELIKMLFHIICHRAKQMCRKLWLKD